MKLTSALLLAISPFVSAAAAPGAAVLVEDPAATDHSSAKLFESLSHLGGVRKPSHRHVNRKMLVGKEDDGSPAGARRKLQNDYFTAAELQSECADPNFSRNCCIGANACDFEGTVFVFFQDSSAPWNLCNGKSACQGITPSFFSEANVDQGACNGDFACRNAAAAMYSGSCIGKNACLGFMGDYVGVGSCVSSGACRESSSAIEDDSCNGQEACQGSSGNINENSCNAKGACKNSSGRIGVRSCNALRACKDNEARIRNRACNGKESCLNNVIEVARRTCNADFECQGTNVPI